MRVKRSKDEWKKLIHEQKGSGKSISGFCKENGIHPNLFYRNVKAAKAVENGTFVKVSAPVQQKNVTIMCGRISVSLSGPVTKEEIVVILTGMKEAGYAELS